MLVRDLVMTGIVKNDTSIQLLSSLPFSIRQPSEQLLTDLEVVAHKLQTYLRIMAEQCSVYVVLCAGVAVISRDHAGTPGSSAEFCHPGAEGVQCQMCSRDPR
jgi:hypothetical protein